MADRAEDVIGDFIATAPLYQRLDLSPYVDELKGNELNDATPILCYCPNAKCRAERPYTRKYSQTGFNSHAGTRIGPQNIHTMMYECTHCKNTFWCSVEASKISEGKWWMRKIGQVPPYDISIASDLEVALGDDAVLYKRAQICMSQSFGIAACSYLRRLLENQIAPLLRLVYEARKAEGEYVDDLAQIMDERIAEKKIRLANQVLPDSLTVEGDNPLELIYDKLSAGIHRQSEQECMEASQVLRYVIISINNEYQRRRSKSRYVDMIRDLRKRGS